MPQTDDTVRIAMWSGPRNLSTALMRAFESRPDCAVWDEPFYGAYLHLTGIEHPMRETVLAAAPTDPAAIALACVDTAPGGAAVFYQKHMTHHMLEGMDLSFIDDLRNAFLIRDPADVAASYERKREAPTLSDLGVERQAAMFDREAERLGNAPPVVDARRLAASPRPVLAALCERLGIGFDEAMLAWPAGRRESDGVWAAHWYGAVERSTGFSPLPEEAAPSSDHAKRLADAARPFYERLAPYAL